MGRYLIVAHQTASSPELIERAQQINRDDPSAEFVLLVPATQPRHLLTWAEGKAKSIAAREAEAARAALAAAGLTVLRTEVGDASPLMAIDDEVRDHAGEYDAIVVWTFPPGISRWLKIRHPPPGRALRPPRHPRRRFEGPRTRRPLEAAGPR